MNRRKGIFQWQYDMKKRNGNQLKKVILYVCRVLFIWIILWIVFHNHYKEIYANIRTIKLKDLIIIIILGTSYQFLGAYAFYCLVRKNNQQFTIYQSIETVYLGFFGNIAGLSFGSIPMRTYYLHTHHIDMGKAMSLINTDYIFHKCSVLICNTLLLTVTGFNVLKTRQNIIQYILFGYVICLFIIMILLLIGFSKYIYSWIKHIISLLPDKEKWKTIKEKMMYHLETMYSGSRGIKGNGKNVFIIIIVHCIKLLIMYGIPFVCLRAITNFTGSFLEMQTLGAVTNLISSALPNVSGIGAAELAFFVVFGEAADGVSVVSVLILYRLATYFVPFLISVIVFSREERIRIKKGELLQK